MNGRVLVVTAHPDDPEFAAGGTIAKLATEGCEVTYVLGVARVEFLGYEDGEIEDTRPLRRDVTREIRRWRPGLIITSHPSRGYSNFFAWHRDHRIIAGVVLDCVYPLARDHLSFPELLPEYEPHKVREVYLVQWEQPKLIMDVAETMELKLQAARHGYRYAEGFDRVVLPG